MAKQQQIIFSREQDGKGMMLGKEHKNKVLLFLWMSKCSSHLALSVARCTALFRFFQWLHHAVLIIVFAFEFLSCCSCFRWQLATNTMLPMLLGSNRHFEQCNLHQASLQGQETPLEFPLGWTKAATFCLVNTAHPLLVATTWRKTPVPPRSTIHCCRTRVDRSFDRVHDNKTSK